MKNTIPLVRSKHPAFFTQIKQFYLPLAIMAQLPPQPRIFGPTDNVQLKSIRTSGTQPPQSPNPSKMWGEELVGRTTVAAVATNVHISQWPPLWNTHSSVRNNGRDLHGTIQWQHELSTQTSNEGAALCAQHYNLRMCVGRTSVGPWGQALRGFKVIPCLPNIHQS